MVDDGAQQEDALEPLIWDQHCCLPLSLTTDVTALRRLAAVGAGFVSVNVGYAPHGAEATFELLLTFGKAITEAPGMRLAGTVRDVLDANAGDELAVAFDLEDCAPLEGRLELVGRYHELGVRTLVPTYNYRNAAGGGCLDDIDDGLTAYGRDLVAEMNRVGMVVDGSHCGARTGLDLCVASTQPVIYSHSGMRSVWDHERNITDEQAVACAETGGVIGIAGVGIFLGENEATIDALVRHIDYAVELVGHEHVGFGSDFPFDHEDFNRELTDNPDLFPECYRRWGPINFLPPEDVAGLPAELDARGYSAEVITAILGGNFRRVAEQVWSTAVTRY